MGRTRHPATDRHETMPPHRDAAGSDDQARTMGPAEAVELGASFLVIGRPITAAADPRAAADRIAAETGGPSAAPAS